MLKAKKRENEVIECVRLLSCIAILFIHTSYPLPPQYRGDAVAIARFAVPFLLVLSGWYTDHDGEIIKAKKKLKDTMRVILYGGSLCIFWNCLNSYFKTGSFLEWMKKHLTMETAVNFLFCNRAVFLNSVYYYFFILIYVYGIFIIMQRLHLTKPLGIAAPFLLAVGIYICEFTNLPWYYGGNAFFVGLPLFFVGYLLRQHQSKLKRIKSKEWIFITIGILVTLIESHCFGGHYLYIGAVITAIFLFIYCINHEQMHCPTFLVAAGTELTLPMIVIHCQVRDTLNIIRDFGSYGLPILVLICSVLLAAGYQKIRGR